MNMEEAVARIAEVSENSVLVARPPLTWGSEAMFIELTSDFHVPASVVDAGYVYLLEREDIENLLVFLRTKRVSGRTIAEYVIHYSMTDAHPAWINDIPSI